MGLGEWFTDFCGALVIQDGGTIAARSKLIVRRLNNDFRSLDSSTNYRLYVGSYGRNTGIKSSSDVDLLYEMPYKEYEKYNGYASNGQSAFLQSVRSSLIKTYPTTKISGDGQVCVVVFDDGISFDILPAFVTEGGGYTFANSNNGGSWKFTNPKPEIDAMRARDSICNNNLVALCRMMRAWKREWSVPISGMLIDTLAYQFINTWEHRNKSYYYFDYLSRDFFYYLSQQDSEKKYWKAPGSNQFVYSDSLFQYKALRCYNIAVSAIAFETSSPKKEWSAKQKWREIYGSQFPE